MRRPEEALPYFENALVLDSNDIDALGTALDKVYAFMLDLVDQEPYKRYANNERFRALIEKQAPGRSVLTEGSAK